MQIRQTMLRQLWRRRIRLSVLPADNVEAFELVEERHGVRLGLVYRVRGGYVHGVTARWEELCEFFVVLLSLHAVVHCGPFVVHGDGGGVRGREGEIRFSPGNL